MRRPVRREFGTQLKPLDFEQRLTMDNEQIAAVLSNQHILITGGTGSFGHQIVTSLLAYEPRALTVYSRDEKKQYDMSRKFAEYDNIRFLPGDVRDYERTFEVCRDVDIVFHAAAMKQVPSSEQAPFEAVKTNIIGAENLRRAAIANRVKMVVAISTDKAVKPVNVMGMSKAIQERIMLNAPHGQSETKFVCVRYGNVLGSRGSVVPLFKGQILRGKPLTITHPDMTRFLLTLPEAVELVLWATTCGEDGDLWVRKMPAANIVDLAETLALGLTGRSDYPREVVGTRAGEKLHEVLVSEEEMWRANEFEQHYLIPAWSNCQLHGSTVHSLPEYSSNSHPLLSKQALFGILSTDGWFADQGARNDLRLAS
jgi:FlaA1/EpsC-like NDP-sugar epimerase